MRCEVPILVAEGDKVAANIRVFFRKSINQRMVQFDIAAFYTLRDGQIARSAKSSIPSIWSSRCSNATSAAILTGRRSSGI